MLIHLMYSRFYKQVRVRMKSFTKSDLEERDLMFNSAHLTVSLLRLLCYSVLVNFYM